MLSISSVTAPFRRTPDRTTSNTTPNGAYRSCAALWRQLNADGAEALAGNIAFRTMFAFFPTLISLLWLLRFIGADGLVGALTDAVGTIVPGAAHAPLKEQVQQAPAPQSHGDFSIGVGIALCVAVWAIASAFRATTYALNAIYEVAEKRSAMRQASLGLAVALGTLMLLVVALVLIASGTSFASSLTRASGLDVGFRWVWLLISWLVVLGVVFLGLTLTYYFAPSVDAKHRPVGTGAAVALGLWLFFTAGFSVYINVLSHPDETYGALAGVAAFMVYLYGSSLVLLIGAEVNHLVADGKRRREP